MSIPAYDEFMGGREWRDTQRRGFIPIIEKNGKSESVFENAALERLHSSGLSLDALGLLFFILVTQESKPVTKKLIIESGKSAKDKVTTILCELKRHSLIIQTKVNNKGGKFQSEIIGFMSSDDLKRWAKENGINPEDYCNDNRDSQSDFRKQRLAVLKRDKYTCVYCRSTEDLTVDHVIPQSRGGTHDASNLVACCNGCNSEKGARTPEEWLGYSLEKRIFQRPGD
jgi:hypothetical protein